MGHILSYMGLRTQENLLFFKGSARKRRRRRNRGCLKVWKEKGKQQHQKHRSALRALKKEIVVGGSWHKSDDWFVPHIKT